MPQITCPPYFPFLLLSSYLNNPIRAALCHGATYDPADKYFSAGGNLFTNELPGGNGYTNGGLVVTSTVELNEQKGQIKISVENPSWLASDSGITANACAFYLAVSPYPIITSIFFLYGDRTAPAGTVFMVYTNLLLLSLHEGTVHEQSDDDIDTDYSAAINDTVIPPVFSLNPSDYTQIPDETGTAPEVN